MQNMTFPLCFSLFLCDFAAMFELIVTSIPMFVCGFLSLQFLLCLCRRRDSLMVWLLLWSLVATALYACHFIFFNRLMSWLPISDSVYVLCNLSVYPLYLVYLYKLTDERSPSGALQAVSAVYGVLALLVAVLVAVAYGAMTPTEQQQFFAFYLYGADHLISTGTPYVQMILHNACKVLFAAGVVLTIIVGGRRMKRFNTMVDQLYADTDDKSLSDLSNLLIIFLVVALMSLIVNFIGRLWFVSEQGGVRLWLTIPSLLFSILLCAIGWMGQEQRFSIRDMVSYAPSAEEDSLEIGKMQSVASDFVTLMDNEQLYLQPDLRLDVVVKLMGSNRTYLQQALNEQLGMTFSEYVNRRRIEYACRLIARNANISRQEIATICGYNSPATFYRIYKKYAVEGLV